MDKDRVSAIANRTSEVRQQAFNLRRQSLLFFHEFFAS
jgi:hypothetical protein